MIYRQRNKTGAMKNQGDWWLLKGLFIHGKKKEVQEEGNGENKYNRRDGREMGSYHIFISILFIT
jgi:hypothetical protein